MKTSEHLYSIESTFGENAEGYATFRPDYPTQIFDFLRQRCRLSENTTIFEIGPGTGLATKQLLDAGCQITAVEPDTNLADILDRSTKKYAAQLEIFCGPFETAPLSEKSFDLGIAAMSLHWLDAQTTLHKAFSLLRPGGHWAMWWTIFGDPNSPDDFQRKSNPLFRELPPSPAKGYVPGKSYGLDREQRVNDLQKTGFKNIKFEKINWQCPLNTEQVVGLTKTFSPVAALENEKRNVFLRGIAEIVDNEFNGVVVREFTTTLYIAQRL